MTTFVRWHTLGGKLGTWHVQKKRYGNLPRHVTLCGRHIELFSEYRQWKLRGDKGEWNLLPENLCKRCLTYVTYVKESLP